MAKTKEELKEINNKLEEINNAFKELTPEELNEVKGGVCHEMEYFDKESSVNFIFNVGDTVEVMNWFYIGSVKCKITAVTVEWEEGDCSGGPGMPGSAWHYAGFVDKYYCQEEESHWYFSNGWKTRDEIQI